MDSGARNAESSASTEVNFGKDDGGRNGKNGLNDDFSHPSPNWVSNGKDGGSKLDNSGHAPGTGSPGQEDNFASAVAAWNFTRAYVAEKNPLKGIKDYNEARVAFLQEAKYFLKPTSFSKPSHRSELLSRLFSNLKQFRLSYCLLFFVIFAWFFLTSPLLLMEVGLLGVLWFLYFRYDGKEKIFILVPITIIAILFGGLLYSFFYVLLLSLAVIALHGSFHMGIPVDPLDSIDTGAVVPPPDFV